MDKIALITGALLSLTACTMVPKQASFILHIDRDYKSVADCSWVKISKEGMWKHANLDSLKRVEFAFANAGRIDISEAQPRKTVVAVYMPTTIRGTDHWRQHFQPIFDSCS